MLKRLMIVLLLGITLHADGKEMIQHTQNTTHELLSGTLKLEIGEYTFRAKLYANASTLALQKRLPLTLNMHDLHSNEKYFHFLHALPSSPAPIDVLHTGDLMLWQDTSFVLFYKTFSTSYMYTKLGYLEETTKLQEALGKSDVLVTLTWDR